MPQAKTRFSNVNHLSENPCLLRWNKQTVKLLIAEKEVPGIMRRRSITVPQPQQKGGETAFMARYLPGFEWRATSWVERR
jgi:hypothetical protein